MVTFQQAQKIKNEWMNKQTNKQTNNNNNKGTTPVPQGGQFFLFIY